MLAGIISLLSVCFASGVTEAEEVDLVLVLAIDVSSSVNYDEFGLQMNGYASAFRSEDVHAAILSGPYKKIAIAITQWAGLTEQRTMLNWTILGSKQDAENVAIQIENMPRAFPFGGTAISGALDHAYALLAKAPHTAPRKVIDLSGDGEISLGVPPQISRNRIVAQSVTINGLPILNEFPELDLYYSDYVIGGPGAFVEIAQGYEDFSRAIARKLVREINGKWFGM